MASILDNFNIANRSKIMNPKSAITMLNPTSSVNRQEKKDKYKKFLEDQYGSTGTELTQKELAKEFEKQSGMHIGDGLDEFQEKSILDTNINAATNATNAARQADIDQFQGLAPMAQRKLLGGLNARGLGSSVAAGGSGSGYLGALANRQASDLGGIELGYDNLLNSLAQRRRAGKYDIGGFYDDLSNAKKQAKNNEAGFLDYLGGAIEGISSFI